MQLSLDSALSTFVITLKRATRVLFTCFIQENVALKEVCKCLVPFKSGCWPSILLCGLLNKSLSFKEFSRATRVRVKSPSEREQKGYKWIDAFEKTNTKRKKMGAGRMFDGCMWSRWLARSLAQGGAYCSLFASRIWDKGSQKASKGWHLWPFPFSSNAQPPCTYEGQGTHPSLSVGPLPHTFCPGLTSSHDHEILHQPAASHWIDRLSPPPSPPPPPSSWSQ